MSDHDHPTWKLLDQIQMDLRQLTAKVVELRSQVSSLELTKPALVRCQCGTTFRTHAEYQEHAYHHHDASLPDHWAKADRLAGDAKATLQAIGSAALGLDPASVRARANGGSDG